MWRRLSCLPRPDSSGRLSGAHRVNPQRVSCLGTAAETGRRNACPTNVVLLPLGLSHFSGRGPRRNVQTPAAGYSPPSGRLLVLRGELESWSRSGMGNWETCFWFSTFPDRRCGNVEISPAFGETSKGARGKSGKPTFGFPRFPQLRHFHSPRSPFFFASPGRLHSLSVCPLACCFFVSTAQAPRLRVLLADGTFVATPEVPAADLIPLD